MANRMNNLTGKEWLTYSFSILKDIRKSKEEISLKHPALFPTQLVERFIKIFTREDGEVILDPFLGIGTSLIASINTSRKGIGCELNKEFALIAKERLNLVKSELFSKNLYDQKILIGDNRKL